MQAIYSILSSGIAQTSILGSLDILQGYIIAVNTVAEVLLSNGRALWAAIWLLGGGVAG